jgi:hypothetical protein
MDGLNEMPFKLKQASELNRFIHTYAHHRFMILVGSSYTALYGFRTALLQRLAARILKLLVNYLRAERPQVAREIYGDPQLKIWRKVR